MINLTEITLGEFRDRQERYDFLIGEKESWSKFYEFSCCYGSNKFSICLIRNSCLKPQIEIHDNKLIVGHDQTLTIINFETKERREYPVFVFYEFYICGDRIIVLGELEVFCIQGDKVVWKINDFGDIIDFNRWEEGKFIVSTYEERKQIAIDIITGKQKVIKS